MTNNPRKIDELKKLGVKITERVPHVLPTNEYNKFYLETKALKSGHLIDLNGKERFLEQSDRPIIQGMTATQIKEIQSHQ